MRRRGLLWAVSCAFALITIHATAQSALSPGERKLPARERKQRIAALSDEYRKFLLDVEPIITDPETDTFLLLESDPQRERYVSDFWHRRDVAAGTTNDSFRKRYYEALEYAKNEFESVMADRSRIYLLNGPPPETVKV